MWPTSIAVWNAARRRSRGTCRPPSAPCRSAKRGSKSRPASTPRRCQPSRFAPATNCPCAQRLVGDHLALEADRAERAAGSRRTRRGSPRRSRAGTDGRAPRRASPARSGRRRERARARRCRPPSSPASPSTSRATSTPRNSASASQRLDIRRLDSLGRDERLGKDRRARHRACNLEVGREVAVLAGDERVLAGARGREEVDRLGAAHHPRLGLDVVGPRGRSARRSARTPRAAARSSPSSPASSRSNEYASFMMNSRSRIRPPRGRGSSRSFVGSGRAPAAAACSSAARARGR